MGIAYNTTIVREGLVLHLDAANVKSYPGSGTVWKDLSGNGNNGTLVNGVGYNSANNGVFTLDGIDDYINIPINLQNMPHTIIAVARYTGVKSLRVVTSSTGNWLMGWWGGQIDKYYAEGWVSPSSGGSFQTSWINYSATGNTINDQWALYKNGDLVVGPNNSGVNGPNGIRIGMSGSYPSEISSCEVSTVLAYTRVLSAAEIKQNFEANRGRYGI